MAHTMASVLTLVLLLARTPVTPAAEPEPVTQVDILVPAAGQELRGTVEIRVRLAPPEGRPQPYAARASVGGPPWIELQ